MLLEVPRCLFRQLLEGGLMHANARTAWGVNFADFTQEAVMDIAGDGVLWRESPLRSLDPAVLASLDSPFADEGGLRLLQGNFGRSVMKVSAVAREHWIVEAPAVVIDDQDQLAGLFETGKLKSRLCCCGGPGSGAPGAMGMPELHKLTPFLRRAAGPRAYRVALVTDGRMSWCLGQGARSDSPDPRSTGRRTYWTPSNGRSPQVGCARRESGGAYGDR